MQAVVLQHRGDGSDGRKNTACNALCLHLLADVLRQTAQDAKAVHHEAHLHALRRLALEHIPHPVPDLAFGHNKILHKDKLLRRFQRGNHLLEQRITHGVIGHLAVVVGREAQPGQIAEQPVGRGNAARQALACQPSGAPLDQVQAGLHLEKQIKQRPEYRQHGDGNNPGQLEFGVCPLVDDIDDHDGRQQRIGGELAKGQQQHRKLHGEQQNHKNGARAQHAPHNYLRGDSLPA